ncbi:transposase [Dactylosporangium sp. NPDC005572]|uniref:transposase n=1 Tax=Dactylosporangium sp. NPDC005572 TaxID=3156889 RepID=UPI0033AB7AA1
MPRPAASTTARRSTAGNGTSPWTPKGSSSLRSSPPRTSATGTGAKLLIITLPNACTQLRLLWADAGYDGKAFTGWIHAVARITMQIVTRAEAHAFTVLPRRWVVERSLAWLLRYRRLARDYERRPDHHEAMIYWATIWIMTRRLARRSTDPPLQ